MRIETRVFLFSFCAAFLLGCSTSTDEQAIADASADSAVVSDGDLHVADEEAAPTSSDTPSVEESPLEPPPAAKKREIPQEIIDAPVRKIVQQYPDKTPHRQFEAKVMGKNKVMLHGPYTEYYPNGEKQKTAFYEYGAKTGEWTFFGKDATPRKHGRYENDKQQGEWKKFRKDGSLEWVEVYKDGIADGTWVAYAADGKAPVWRRSYRAGERHGKWENFHPNGQRATLEIYSNGKLNGMAQSWFDNGQLSAEGTYVDGKRDGSFRFYGRSGNLQNETQWTNGVRG